MRIPKQIQKNAARIYNACKVNGYADEGKILTAIDILTQQKPRGWRLIVEHIKTCVSLDCARRTVLVQSSTNLQQSEIDQIQQLVSKQTNNIPHDFKYQTDASLLGGLRVQIGWTVLDASIRSRLNQIVE